MSVPYEFGHAAIYNIQELNSSFAVGTLKVMYLGENRNHSYFSKPVVKKALDSLKNVPIVCHWNDETNEIGGHDISIVSDENGVRIKNLTEPCGVVPDHAQFKFKKECDENGDEHEYLIVEGVILWKRQDVYRYIADNLCGKVKHSMEINVLCSEQKDNYINITDFEFTALCLLGNCEPCFQGSELELFSVENFKQKMNQMMSEMESAFSHIDASIENYLISSNEDGIELQQSLVEGGEETLIENVNVPEEIEAENNIGADTPDDTSLPDDSTNVTDCHVADDPVEFASNDFALESEVRDELIRALEAETVQYDWGECRRYWFVDYDNSAHNIYCWDTNDWLLYGFDYEVDGDAITIVWDSKRRKKFDIVDFDNGEQSSPLEQMFVIVKEKCEENASLKEKYEAMSNNTASIEEELSALRQFKEDTEAAISKKEKETIFARFSNLNGVEEFEELKNKAAEYDVATIEEKCFAILGKNSYAKFSVESVNSAKASRIKIDKPEATATTLPYGGLFEQYGILTK